MNKSKHEKFLKISKYRSNKIINMIRLLGNCSNRFLYDYNEKDVKDVFDSIEIELKKIKEKF